LSRCVRLKNVFDRKIGRKSPLCSCIIFASKKFMHRPKSDSPLHFDIQKTCTNRTGKKNAVARRLLSATLPKHWPQVCRVRITFELLLNNWFVFTKTNVMACFVKWISLNMCVCSNPLFQLPMCSSTFSCFFSLVFLSFFLSFSGGEYPT